jgi:hypothetical protein
MSRSAIAIITLFGWMVAAALPADAKRIAFVVGIDSYDNLPAEDQLQKAVNDATAVGAAFERLGFKVHSEVNPGRIRFYQSWSRFLDAVEPGDTAALFFSGHGIEMKGVNYLVPSDVPQVSDGDQPVLEAASIQVNELIAKLKERGPLVTLVVLDACRDNPFVVSGGSKSLGGAKGLSRVEPPRGVFVMFSADAGQRALDRLPQNDSDPNSIYTRNLLPLLETPGMGLRQIAVAVRDQVDELARSVGHSQFPAYYDAMQGKDDLYLAGRGAPEPDDRPIDRKDPKTDPCTGAEADWQSAFRIGTVAAFQDHLDRFLSCKYAALARVEIDKSKPLPPPPDVCAGAQAHYQSAAALGTASAFQDHLDRFGSCNFAGLALAAINQPPADPCAGAQAHWQSADSIGTVPALQDHLSRFGSCSFAGLATSRIEDLGRCAGAQAHWQSALSINSKSAYEDHLARFPTCDFVGLARTKIAALPPPPPPPQRQLYLALYDGIDFYGGDLAPRGIGASSLTGCAQLCADRQGCTHFTYNTSANLCFVKRGFDRVDRFAAARSGQIFAGTSRSEVPRIGGGTDWQIQANADYFQNDIDNGHVASNVQECQNICAAMSNCMAFSFIHPPRRVTNRCWVKHTAGSLTTKSGVTSGRRVPSGEVRPSEIIILNAN